jgi:periplasmic divalent cation tolerance protein
MKKNQQYAIVFITTPDLKTAKNLVQSALESKLIACGNIISGIQSYYWWKGKIEKSKEALIIIKTTKEKLNSLQKFIVQNHPYDTPEFIAVKITNGFDKYLDWISISVDK